VWWGRSGHCPVTRGGRYDEASDSWTPTSTLDAPVTRCGRTVVWSGSEMIVWGGGINGGYPVNTGGRYDVGSDSWTPTSTLNAPSARAGHTAVWNGKEMSG